MKVLFFTKYTYAGASSRYRVFQYLPFFEAAGFSVQVLPFFTDEYLRRKYNKQPVSAFYVAGRYLNRIWNVLKLGKGTAVYIEYELLPYFPAFFERWLRWRGIQYVVDYDDAIFHNYDWKGNSLVKHFLGKKIPSVMRMAAGVITGSEYLTSFAKRYNVNVIEVPTSVNFAKYEAVEEPEQPGHVFTVGWIGTPSSGINVVNILPSLSDFLKRNDARLLLIGFDSKYGHLLQDLPVRLEAWSEEDEIARMKTFDVGIMPLDDNPFNRGKCGFKLIQYMACGVPTVFSPLQANVNINKNNLNLPASTLADWEKALTHIFNESAEYRRTVGAENKKVVKEHYSIEVNGVRLLNVFKTIFTTCAE